MPRLIEGHVTQGWREAWGEMVARWPERFADRACEHGGAGCRYQATGRAPGASRSTRWTPRRSLTCSPRRRRGRRPGRDPAAEAACAGLAGDWAGLAGLHAALAIAAADLDEAIAEHTGILHP